MIELIILISFVVKFHFLAMVSSVDIITRLPDVWYIFLVASSCFIAVSSNYISHEPRFQSIFGCIVSDLFYYVACDVCSQVFQLQYLIYEGGLKSQ